MWAEFGWLLFFLNSTVQQNTNWIVSQDFLDLVLGALCYGEMLKLIIFTFENTA